MLDVSYHLCTLFNDDVFLLVCFRANIIFNFYFILGFGLIYIATKCYVEMLITFFHMVLGICLCLVFDYCRLCILLKVFI